MNKPFLYTVIILLSLFCFFGCSRRGNASSQEEVKESKGEEADSFYVNKREVADKFVEHKSYSFPVSSSEPSNFGYLSVSDGEDIGVSAISLWKGYAILVDTYFSNLKMVDLRNGSVKVSSQIGSGVVTETGVWLGEATIFNDSIFVCGLDNIFVFDKSLENIKSIAVDRGTKRIWSRNADSMCVYVDYMQRENKEIVVDLVCFSSDGSVNAGKEILGPDIFAETFREKRTGGLRYRIVENSSNYFLETASGVFRLQSGIPEILQYDAVNLAFTSNEVAYFSLSSDTLTLHYYLYP
jgi:hypothetical protein